MAMLRSSLGRVARRLRESSVAPSVMCQRGPKILQTPPLASIYPARTWILPTGAQLMRTFTSPATAASSAAHTRRISNLQVQQHFPVFSKGTEGMKLTGQNRFFSAERKEPVIRRFVMWVDKIIEPRHEMIFIAIVGFSAFVATTIAYRRLGSSIMALNNKSDTSEDVKY